MAKFICILLGFFFLFVALLGFLAPGLMDLHLNQNHNFIHLLTGVLALFFGFGDGAQPARKFALTFGLLYLFVGIMGIHAPAGSTGLQGLATSNHMLRLVPGELEFGTPDSILHAACGAVLILAAIRLPGGKAKNAPKNEFLPVERCHAPHDNERLIHKEP